ncbi:Ubiquitin carboxyl-terminal hydrolase [Phytophthora megakarya]|uniref:Ubiquitin carboxyl-terminal hydrolase n=1 Tax=Phytophthora megakarya TaxID=4795 RepID=A0A225WYQ9_9STRA|nr:Ubiquitin carboxyl-terminal hydrolase [Phytophthora megakarya]
MKKLVFLGSHMKPLVTYTNKLQLNESSIDSIFRLGSGEGTVKLGNLVGLLALDRILSDTIIDFSGHCICNWVSDCYAMDLFAPTFGNSSRPANRISGFHFVVLSVHLNGIHWSGSIGQNGLPSRIAAPGALLLRATMF